MKEHEAIKGHDPNSAGRFVGFLFVLLVVGFVVLPVVVVAVVSFGEAPYLEFPPANWSSRWYVDILRRPEWVSSIAISLELAVTASLLSVVIGGLASLGIHRHVFLGRDAVTSFLLSPLLIPGILVGMALLMLSSRAGLGGGFELLVAGHVLVTMPYVVRLVLASLPGAAQSLEEAALTLGADPVTALWRITLPAIRPGLVAGGIFAFVTSFDNVSISLFLTRPTTATLPVRILNAIEYSWDPSIAAVSTLSVVLGLVLMLALDRTVGLQIWVTNQTVGR